MRRVRYVSELIEEPPLNLTSLIDVVFIILITFIVIAPLLDLDEVALAPGKESTDEIRSVSQTSPIILHVRSDDTVLLNNRPTSLDLLLPQLETLRAAHPEAIPQLFHDRNARFGTYQSIKQSIEEAGFAQLDVILQPA